MCIFEVKHYGAQAPPYLYFREHEFHESLRGVTLLIAYKLHESMREDNANVETSYYGVSWMIECVIRKHESHAEEQGDFCEFCGCCVQNISRRPRRLAQILLRMGRGEAPRLSAYSAASAWEKYVLLSKITCEVCLQFIFDRRTKEHKASRPLRLCVRLFTACNILENANRRSHKSYSPICILENTNLTNCTNHHADRDLLIAYKLHASIRGDNANVETSYYGVSWMIENIIREHKSHAEEQGDYCGFYVQKCLTQTTQTGADFTQHGIRVIWMRLARKEPARIDWRDLQFVKFVRFVFSQKDTPQGIYVLMFFCLKTLVRSAWVCGVCVRKICSSV